MKLFKSIIGLLWMTVALGCNDSSEPRACQEALKEDCVCTMQYTPVCGCNNKTYGNACDAGCHGITEFTPGACKDSD